MEQNNGILSKMTTVQKALAILVLILGSLSALVIGGRELVKEIKTTVSEISHENAIETRRQMEELGFLTTDQFMEMSDSIITEMHINRIVNDSLHRRTYLEEREIINAIETNKYSDTELRQEVKELRKQLDQIKGIAELTREEQAAQAYTDSLIGVNALLQQKEIDRQRRRSDELEFDKLTRELRDLSKDVVIDKGRRKTIRTKPNGAKQGPVTKKH